MGIPDSRLHRLQKFQQDFLKMEENGSLIIYSTKTKGFRGRVKTLYYFSKTLQSPVFRLDRYNIAEQFKDNACFLENVIRRDSWPNDYSAWDSKKSSFVIVEIMNAGK